MDVLKTIDLRTTKGSVWIHIMDTGTVLLGFDAGRNSTTVQMDPDEAVQLSKSICEVVAVYDLHSSQNNGSAIEAKQKAEKEMLLPVAMVTCPQCKMNIRFCAGDVQRVCTECGISVWRTVQ
jgi:hypothetical protein